MNKTHNDPYNNIKQKKKKKWTRIIKYNRTHTYTTERLEQQESQPKQIEWFGGGSVLVILGKFIKGRG